MSNTKNSGIIVSGRGSLTADVVAVGHNARAKKMEPSVANNDKAAEINEILDQLKRLHALIREHAATQKTLSPTLRLTDRLREEIARDDPDKLTIKSFLSTIAEETKSVGQIAAAALSLQKLVSAVF